MSTSVDQTPGTRPSSTTFSKVLTVIALTLACGELFLTLHYWSELAAPKYAEDVTRAFQKVYYDSQVWHSSTKWLGIPTQQAPTDDSGMQELHLRDPPGLHYRNWDAARWNDFVLRQRTVLREPQWQGDHHRVSTQRSMRPRSSPYGESAWRWSSAARSIPR